eukprot:1901758-Rhodomonas_salina.1
MRLAIELTRAESETEEGDRATVSRNGWEAACRWTPLRFSPGQNAAFSEKAKSMTTVFADAEDGTLGEHEVVPCRRPGSSEGACRGSRRC